MNVLLEFLNNFAPWRFETVVEKEKITAEEDWWVVAVTAEEGLN